MIILSVEGDLRKRFESVSWFTNAFGILYTPPLALLSKMTHFCLTVAASFRDGRVGALRAICKSTGLRRRFVADTSVSDMVFNLETLLVRARALLCA